MGSNQKKIDYKIKTKIFALLVTNRSMNAIKIKVRSPHQKVWYFQKTKKLTFGPSERYHNLVYGGRWRPWFYSRNMQGDYIYCIFHYISKICIHIISVLRWMNHHSNPFFLEIQNRVVKSLPKAVSHPRAIDCIQSVFMEPPKKSPICTEWFRLLIRSSSYPIEKTHVVKDRPSPK